MTLDSSHVCASDTVRSTNCGTRTPSQLLPLVNDGRHDYEPRLGRISEPILSRQVGSVVTGFRAVRTYEHLTNTMVAFKPVRLPNFIRTVLHCPLLQHRNVLCHVTVFQKYDPWVFISTTTLSPSTAYFPSTEKVSYPVHILRISLLKSSGASNVRFTLPSYLVL